MEDHGFLIFMLAVVVIGLPVGLGVGSEMLKTWLKHREKMAGALNAQAAERAAQYAQHTERLERRVQVLERIVTDRGHDLAGEIEALRDPALPLN
jgi:protein subunit release factor A